jgi:hypothetical protein
MTTHWAAHYIGDAWVNGVHDCWGFFRRVQMEQFGLDLPEIAVDACSPLICRRAFASNDESDAWLAVDVPAEGDAVLMGKSKRPAHVGVWVEMPGLYAVLHCVEGGGVIVQDRTTLKLSGWQIIGFYRRARS